MEYFETENIVSVGPAEIELEPLLLEVDFLNNKILLQSNENDPGFLWNGRAIDLGPGLIENLGLALETPAGNLPEIVSNY